MTEEQIKKWYEVSFGVDNERIVDIDIWKDVIEPFDMYANIITVSIDHAVRKTTIIKHNNIILVETRIRID